jgi:hydroxyethylthiazole kinase-like uncharacterized protein yjeF
MSELSGFLSLEDRPALSAPQMRMREDDGVSLGVSKLSMMENAGNAIARFVADLFPKTSSKKSRVCLIAGTGNNGGDVFVAARHLSYWSERLEAEVMLVGKENEIRAEEASTNWKIIKRIATINRKEVSSLPDITLLQASLGKADLAVVGIFGTGFKGEPRELQKEVIQAINSSSVRKVSVDIPSGMEADSGEYRFAVRSDYTICMDAPKLGMLKEGARQMCGQVLVANIGLPF